MRLRTIIAALGVAGFVALGVSVPAHATPQVKTATTHPAKAATIYPYGDVRIACWGSNTYDGWNWNAYPSGVGNHLINDSQANCSSLNAFILVQFVFSPCAAPPNQGYCSMTEVSQDVAGVWQSTGYCGGWNQSQFRTVKQVCNGANYQYWAGTGTQPDLIWNWWYDTNHHTACPISGGYTQSVQTAESGGAVYLSCPQGAGGQSYLSKQTWYLYLPVS